MDAYATALSAARQELSDLTGEEQNLLGQLVDIEAKKKDLDALILQLEKRAGTPPEAAVTPAAPAPRPVVTPAPAPIAPTDDAPKSLTDKIIALGDGTLTAREIAARLGCEPAYVYKIAHERHLTLKPAGRVDRTPAGRAIDAPLTDNEDRLWRAVVEIRDDGREPLWGELASRSGIAKGSLSYLLENIERKGFIEGYRNKKSNGILVVKRPADMPEPPRAAVVPVTPRPQAAAPAPAAPVKPAQIFTRTASVAPQPTGPAVPADERAIVRFLAKDVGLVVTGPDDDEHYCVEHKKGLGIGELLGLANAHRVRRKEPPFRLQESA